MKRAILLILLFGVLGLSAFMLRFATNPQPTSTTPIVAASFFPLADIVSNVGGDVVAVLQILPNGASPHTFDPRPTDAAALAEAKVFYTIGHGLDTWASSLSSAANIPLVTVDRNITLREHIEIEGAEEDEDHDEGPNDPHYWLTIANAKIITRTVAEDLIARFPEHRNEILANEAAYLEELNAADIDIKRILAPVKNRNIVTFHDAWFYFANTYGLNVVATAEPAAGVEPSPRYIASLKKAITKAGVKTIYAEPQLSIEPLRSFINDEKLRIATIDPEGASNAGSYIIMMLTNAQTIAKNQD